MEPSEIIDTMQEIAAITPDDVKSAADLAERRAERVAQLRREACCPERASRWCRAREARIKAGAPAGNQDWEAALTKMVAAVERPEGTTLGIVGAHGTGKTCLAVAAIRALTEREWSCRFATATELVASFIDARVTGGMRRTHNEWCEPRLLVLDQFEKSGHADWEQRFVFAVLDARHNDGRVSVLIANPPNPGGPIDAQAAQIWGASIQDRMNETGGLILCGWEGFR